MYFKTRIPIILLAALTVISTVDSDVSTTSEPANPFNEFMQPNGGVNLISGDVAFPYNLFTLKGVNGNDVNLSLRYSSNVYGQVRGRNDINPTSWVGLGWDMGFGSILCDHKNTMAYADDEYYWISAEGVRKKIKENSGVLYLEDEPAWKIARVVETTDAAGSLKNYKIKGWVLTDPSGKKYKYGNPDGADGTDDPRLATRLTYCWTESKYVGQGFGGDIANILNYPYQWDLSAIEDIFGNANTFEYDTTAGALKCAVNTGTPSATRLYTKASYLKKITTPQGNYAVFTIIDKKNTEYFDPYTRAAEPDGFLELYETKALDKIQVYSAGQLMKKFIFCYKYIHPLSNDQKPYLKRLLQSVTEKNTDDKVFAKTGFEYYDNKDDMAKDAEGNYHFGALKTVVGPRCAETEYKYEKKYLERTFTVMESNNDGELVKNQVKGGTLSNGNSYICALKQKKKESLLVIASWWNGSNWQEQTLTALGLNEVMNEFNEGTIRFDCGHNYIVIIWKHKGDAIDIYNHLWARVFIFDEKAQEFRLALNSLVLDIEKFRRFRLPGIALGGNNFVFYDVFRLDDTTQNPGGEVDKCTEKVRFLPFHIDLKKLTCSFIFSIPASEMEYVYDLPDGELFNHYKEADQRYPKLFAAAGNDYFVVYKYNYIGAFPEEEWVFKDYKCYKWNGVKWERKDFSFSRDGGINVYPGPDYFVTTYEPVGTWQKEWIDVHMWNGKEWVTRGTNETEGRIRLEDGENVRVFPASDHFVIAHDYGYKIVTRWQWDGNVWCGPNESKIKEEWDHFDISVNNGNYSVMEKSRTTGQNRDDILCFALDRSDNQWYKHDSKMELDSKTIKTAKAGKDFVVACIHRNRWFKWQGEFKYSSNIWDGEKWNTQLVNHENDPNGDRIEDPVPMAIGNSFAMPMWSSIRKINIHTKYQDNFKDAPAVFACIEKNVDDGVTGKSIKVVYEYDEKNPGNYYNSLTGSAEFKKVSVKLADASSTEYTFHSGVVTKTGSKNTLEGKIESITAKNKNGKAVSEEKIDYIVLHDAAWPAGVDIVREKERTSKTDKVTTLLNYYYDKWGNVQYSTQKASNGKGKISKNTYAYTVSEYQTGFVAANMLTQLAQSTVYEVPSLTTPPTDDPPDPTEARSSAVYTYIKDAERLIWTPSAVYVWNPTDLTESLPDFVYTDVSNNPKWDLQQETTLYSVHGLPQESKNAKNTRSTTIYGHRGSLPIAGANNAFFNECAFLTGDFDDNTTFNSIVYIDIDNKWAKGGCTTGEPPKKHFGNNAIHISGSGNGPYKTVTGFTPKGDYVFSAWVYPITVDASKSVKMSVIKSTTNNDPVPGDVEKTTLESNKWNLISRVIPQSVISDITPANSIRIAITAGSGADFWVEDIRFYPKRSLATTTYYDPLFKAPVGTVDANNTVKLVAFNEYGLLSKEYLRNVFGGVTPLKSTDYTFMKCNANILEKRLSTLTSSTGKFGFDPDRTNYTIVVDNYVEKATVGAVAANPNARLGIWAPTIRGYTLECPCGIEEPIPLIENDVTPTIVTVYTDDGGELPYSINFRRLANCWTNAASDITDKLNGPPQFTLVSGTPYIASINGETGKAVVKYIYNYTWADAGGAQASVGKAGKVAFAASGATPYIAYADMDNDEKLTVRKLISGAWQDVGTGGVVSASGFDRAALAFSGTTPYVAYAANKNEELTLSSSDIAMRVFVKSFNGTSWNAVPSATNGIVSDAGTDEFAFGITSAGTPYVAYIYYNEDPAVEDDPNDGKVYVRKYESGAWSDVGSAVSDAYSAKVAMAIDGSNVYVAFTEALSTTDVQSPNHDQKTGYKLRVKKYVSSVWSDVAASMPAVVYMAPEDRFVLKIHGGQPFLYFTNINNNGKASTAKFDGTNWGTYGNPAFTPSIPNNDEFVAGDNASGQTYIAFKNIQHAGAITVQQFQTGCPDANLSNCTVTSGAASVPLVPAFRQYVTNYTGSIKNSSGEVTITATPRGAATVSINGSPAPYYTATITLNEGENKIPVVVTSSSDNETQVTYLLKITRTATAYASFCGFDVYDANSAVVAISPAFQPNIFRYTADVGSGNDFIRIRPVSTNNSYIDAGGVHIPSSYISPPFKLKYGENKIPILITAPDGKTQVEYELIVRRAVDADADLSGLQLLNGTTTVPLSPAFNANTVRYDAEVASTVSSITVKPTGTDVIITVQGADVASGDESASITLSYGANFVTVTSTESGGIKTTTYTVRVVRKPSANVSLSSLTLVDNSAANVALSPGFNGNKLFYTASVSGTILYVNVTPTASNSLSTVTVNDEPLPVSGYVRVDLSYGINIIEIGVTSQDGSETMAYRINLSKGLEYKTPEIAFGNVKLSGPESKTAVKIPVVLSYLSVTDVTVNYAVTGGTATSGADYTLAAGVLTFSPCEAKKEIDLTIVNDAVIEADETIEITLSGPSGGVLGNAKVFTYTILDDDVPEVDFVLSSSSVAKNIPSHTHAIEVSLSANPMKQVSVSFDAIEGSAGKYFDFNLPVNEIVFNRGDPLVKSFNVEILNNYVTRGDKYAVFELQNARNAKYGSVTKHTMTITDYQSGIRYVRADIATPAVPGTPNAGKSWDNAYKYLQDALAEARTDNTIKEIRVGQGTYYPDQYMQTSGTPEDNNDPNASFELVDGANVYGGYTSAEARVGDPELNGTVLSGNIDNNGSSSGNSYHIAKGSQCTFDAFTITEGNDGSVDGGGGILIDNAVSMNIENCKFSNNRTTAWGGAIYSIGTNVTIEKCNFENNYAYGGGAINVERPVSGNFEIIIHNSNFNQNSCGSNGGALFISAKKCDFNYCNFTNNSALGYGGAICLYYSGVDNTSIISNCLIKSNMGSIAGGGLYSWGATSIINTVFSDNSSIRGGALLLRDGDQSIINCVFHYNRAEYGAGIYCYSLDGTIHFSAINNTFYENLGDYGGCFYFDYGTIVSGDEYRPVIKNCIFWKIPSNPPDDINDYAVFRDGGLNLIVNYCWNQETTTLLPPFWDESQPIGLTRETDGLRLTGGSVGRCVDGGDPATDMTIFPLHSSGIYRVDITGKNRKVAGKIGAAVRIDIGAYEKQ